MATKKETTTTKSRLDNLAGFFDLERTFIVFSVIYFPLAILFYREGTLEKVLLAIYTVLLAFVGAILILRFVMFLAKAANEHRSDYGAVFAMYVLQALIPLIMFKVFGYVLVQMVPMKHQGGGILCSIRYFMLDIYYGVFNYQHTLSWLIVGSFVAISLLALWSIGNKSGVAK